jgi:hypothetical protein
MLSPYIDPTTEDYILLNGNIENQNALLTLAYMRLKTPRGKWPYNTLFGNQLQIEIPNTAALDRKILQQQVKLALQDMVQLNYIKDLVVVTQNISLDNREATFLIVMVDNFNNELKFVWSITV